jgi:hypothetical protein
MLVKGIAFGLKEVQNQDLMVKYIMPALKKQGLTDIKVSLIALFEDWIKELKNA